MNIIHSIVLGIVEGLTEFLPVSSTAHLIIFSHFMGLADTEFLKSFEIIIQFGAIFAVIVLYFKRIIRSRDLWKKVLAGFIPTAIIGLLLYKIIKNVLLGDIWLVAIVLIIGGIILVLFEKWYGKKARHGKQLNDITYREAIIIGTVQSLAVIPGVSRSAATIVGGLALGISREAIVEFSFLLAVPVIAAAALLDLVKTPIHFSGHEWGMLIVGLIVSFIVAIFSIEFFLKFVKSNTFEKFGYYRVIVGILVIVLLLLKV